jgi:hypothetical protein
MTVSRPTFVMDLRKKHKRRSDGILTYYMLKEWLTLLCELSL